MDTFLELGVGKVFISVYEDSHDSDLMFCTGIGYLVDNVLPFHVGDIVRAAIIGKKLKNGVAFSLAVIIIDRILDVFVVAFIYGTIFFCLREKSDEFYFLHRVFSTATVFSLVVGYI